MKLLKRNIPLPIIYCCAICLLFIILAGMLFHSFSGASGKPASVRHYEIGYKSVHITAEDTLWGIAKQSYSPEYGTLEDYIQEIMRCNAMKSEYIRAGCFLIVPVYLSVS